MKAAICMATWNKESALPNTLSSIAGQEAGFPWEVCIVDDGSDVDPEPLIRRFLPDAKYGRLDEHVGFAFAQSRTWDLLSEDVDVVVLMSSDVILSQPHVVESLCREVREKQVVLAEVVGADIAPDLHRDFDAGVDAILAQWDRRVVEPPLYTTRCRPHWWLFFLGAARRDDLEAVGFPKNCCDAVLAAKMKSSGYAARVLTDVRGIHQNHPKSLYPCPIARRCSYACSRTRKRAGRFSGKKAEVGTARRQVH